MAWLAVAGTVLSSVLNLFGANKEAQAQTDAENQQMQQFQQTQQNLAPYRQAGTEALANLRDLQNNPESITSDPSYQFRLAQGTDAINASAAARGGYFSGATGQALQNYGQGFASEELGNEFSRLSGLASMGQQAAGTTGQFGAQAVSNAGQYGVGAVQAQNQGWAGVGQNVGTLYGNLQQQNNQQNWMNMMNQGNNTVASLSSLNSTAPNSAMYGPWNDSAMGNFNDYMNTPGAYGPWNTGQ